MTSPSPAAPLKPGDRVRLPSGREATLHHIYVPGNPAPRGTTFRRAWKVSGFPELTYYEDELTLVEAAPPPPPVEGPGLRDLANEIATLLSCGKLAFAGSSAGHQGLLARLQSALVADGARRSADVKLGDSLADAAAALEALSAWGTISSAESLSAYATRSAQAARKVLKDLAITPYDRRARDAEPGSAP